MLSASIGTCFLVHYKDTVLTLFYQITFAQILLQWSIIAAFFFDFASQKHIFTKGRQKDIFSHPHGALFF
jgi:hypothetical protein